MRVYLAGPPFAEEYRRRAAELIRRAGWEPVDPMRRDFRGSTAGHEAEIVRGDLADIDSCNAVLAAFTHPDEGTAMEAWYAQGVGKRVVAYTGGTPPHPWTVYVADAVCAALDDAVAALAVRVRAETDADRPAIAAVTEAAFGKPREARMIDAIRASDGFVPELSLVAEDDGQVVGHVLLSYVELEGTEKRLLELGPMSVLPSRQRAGIGTELVRKALLAADARGEPLVLVLGHPSYYPRFGFRPASELGIVPPDAQIPDAAFMALPLRAYDPAIRGRVRFPPAY